MSSHTILKRYRVVYFLVVNAVERTSVQQTSSREVVCSFPSVLVLGACNIHFLRSQVRPAGDSTVM